MLPGFDGSGRLFASLCALLADEFETLVLSYPPDEMLSYDELENRFKHDLPTTPYVILGESFGGPLALRLSRHADENLKGIILCVTFVTNPRPMLSKLFEPVLQPKYFKMDTPAWYIRYFLLGGVSDHELIEKIQVSNRELTPEVIYGRLKEIVNVDVSNILSECTLPILYLRGRKDWLVHESSMQLIKSLNTKVTTQSFDAPHMLLQLKQKEAAACIKQFSKEALNNRHQ